MISNASSSTISNGEENGRFLKVKLKQNRKRKQNT